MFIAKQNILVDFKIQTPTYVVEISGICGVLMSWKYFDGELLGMAKT